MGDGSHVLRLPDGRDLAVRHYGDPHGVPILYFHGHPGSRMDLDFIDPDNLAGDLGIRIIALDRPGYGRSTEQPGRTLNDWPQDVLAVVDELGIPRFSVLGYSGGGPYALACAARISAARLVRTVVVAGIGPVGSPGQHRSIGWTLYSGAPAPIRGPMAQLSGALASRVPDRLAVTSARMTLPRSDRTALADPRVAAGLLRTWREAFRSGHQGARSDIAIYTRPWGVDVDSIRAPVHVWHGTDDRNVPVSVGRHLAGQIPGCSATIVAGAGHLSIVRESLGEILSSATA